MKDQKISSELKIRAYFQSKIDPSFHRDLETSPYAYKSNIKVICDFYKVSPLYIVLKYCEEIDWVGIFFWTSINANTHIFSGGRFGYAGFFSKKINRPIGDYLPLIDDWLKREDIASCSLSFLFTHNEIYKQSYKGWVVKEINYLVASMVETVREGQLLFPKSKKRNIMRNLKKAETNHLQFAMTSDENELRIWYHTCHLKRISELSGKKWSYELLFGLLNEGTGKLALVRSKYGEILGGCFVLLSKETLEIFMMSTPRANLDIGVNFFLTKYLYIYAREKNIKYANWQSSNPPKGGLVDFKKGFNSKEMSFLLYNKVRDKEVKVKDVMMMYKDFFIFPDDHK